MIESPINYALSFDVGTTSDFVTISGISSIFSGDILKVNDNYEG